MVPLAKGAYGTVFEIDHAIYGKAVVKRIEMNDGFLHPLELDILCRFDHPNIIKSLDLYPSFSKGVHYMNIVMEKADSDAFTYIKNKKPLCYKDLVSVLHQCISAVNALHEEDIIHLDIKPNNILFKRRDGIHAWLIDYGLARKIFPGAPNARRNKIIDEYTPPENRDNYRYGKHTDIWTLGLTFSYIISGRMMTCDDDWSRDRARLLNLITATYREEEKEHLKELLTHMLCSRNERFTAKQLLSLPIFANCTPIKGGCLRQKIEYSTLPDNDKVLFSRFWKFINRPEVSPRTVCNCIDLYHRYMYYVQCEPDERLAQHKLMSLCACFMIASNINDDIRPTAHHVISGIVGKTEGISELVTLLHEYITIITVTCRYNISNAPMYDYIIKRKDKDKFKDFCHLLPNIHVASDYSRILINSPCGDNDEAQCYVNMAVVFSNNIIHYDACCSC